MNNSDKKITELPLVQALDSEDMFAVVHNGITSRVSLRTIMNQAKLSIPQARITVAKDSEHVGNGHDQVFASWEGSDMNFMDFNPQFWLYRYRKADVAKVKVRAVKGDFDEGSFVTAFEPRPKRFVHPSHMHGGIEMETIKFREGNSYTNFYKGEQIVFEKGEKILLPGRQTEWSVDKLPYVETPLMIEPWKYFKFKGQSGGETLNPKDFPTLQQPIPKGTHSNNARLVVFKVRIAIDNPLGDPRQPKLFGPFSETFIFAPLRIKDEFVCLKCYLGEEAAPMMRKRLKFYTMT